MDRRSVLAGTALAVAVALVVAAAMAAGVLGGGGGKPVGVKATRVVGNETDVRCTLPADVVTEHPVLAEVLSEAREKPRFDWAMRNVTVDRAEAIVSHLEYVCDRTGGVYVYQNETFFVSFPIHDPELAEELHDGDGHQH